MARLPSLNLSSVADLIFKRAEETAEERRSNGIGISTLGEECDRKLWYDFRWVSPLERFPGKLLKLFETGHREEARMIHELRTIGIVVHDKDPERRHEQQKQFRVQEFGGHLSGYLDGVCRRGIPELPNDEAVLECKTHNANQFEKLKDKGVRRSHPKHFVQCMMGMGLRGLKWAFYFGKNKNDDDRHTEIVAFDQKIYDELKAKAESIIFAEVPPDKIANSAEFPPCSFCVHRKLCHQQTACGIVPQMTCRSCLHVTPRPDGTWHCSRFDRTLSKEEQESGCPAHLYIPSLLPYGKPIDAGQSFVVYEAGVINEEGGKFSKLGKGKRG